MSATRRIGIAVLLLALGMAVAVAADFAYGEVVIPANSLLIRSPDGGAISLLTGSYVLR